MAFRQVVRVEMIDSAKRDGNLPGGSSSQRSGRTLIWQAVKRIVPQTLVQEFRQYKTYSKEEWPVYLKTRLMDAVDARRAKPGQLPRPVRSILFVCFGNIMRSPMCEALMNQALAGIPTLKVSVTSAGVNAIAGRPAHPWAIAAAHELGISLENHRARPLTSELVEQTDLIFVMDYQNRVQLLTRYSSSNRKVLLFGLYAGADYPGAEIHDPYYLGEEGTRHCYEILQICVRKFVSHLSSEFEASKKY